MDREASHSVETQKPEPGTAGREAARAGPAKIQPVLMASLVAAIILLIAFGAFWTSF